MANTCNRCGRALKTEKSRLEGYGPVCKRKALAAGIENREQQEQANEDTVE